MSQHSLASENNTYDLNDMVIVGLFQMSYCYLVMPPDYLYISRILATYLGLPLRDHMSKCMWAYLVQYCDVDSTVVLRGCAYR